MLKSTLYLCAALACVLVAGGASRADTATSVTAKAESVVSKLTLDEKIAQLVNAAPAIPRLGIPAYSWWTESLHGTLAWGVPTTNFPEPVGLAATFDTALLKDVATVIRQENQGAYQHNRKLGLTDSRVGAALNTWAPNINIFRDPRWGRGQETYGEDPYLTARMGVAYIEGMQGSDPDRPEVIATPKHYAVHSGPESTRHKVDIRPSLHDLEDTYLPAFRAAIVEAHAGSIMCAYNSVDGQPACANDLLLKELLRGAWGFNGYVVSDCDAVKDIASNHKYVADQPEAVAAALKAGVDNECVNFNSPAVLQRYKDALSRGLITEKDIDRALVRLFAARVRTGDLPGLDHPKAPQKFPLPLTTPEHSALALKTAEESLVLLKNNGVLPLSSGTKVALVGPLADSLRVLRGNYSSGSSGPRSSVLQGLRNVLNANQVDYVPYGPSVTDGDSVPSSLLRGPDGSQGLKTSTTPTPDGGKPGLMVSEGYLVPDVSGTYRIGFTDTRGSFVFDGQPVQALGRDKATGVQSFITVDLEKGKSYPIRFSSKAWGGLAWQRISRDPAGDLARAAAKADVIVAVVGLTADLEGEEMGVKAEGFSGGDKMDLRLPRDQMEFLEKAKATGKPLIIVAMNGSPIALQWGKDNAAAILEAWYPGQAGGDAIANVLSGRSNPAGRLPLTFYASVDDLPPFDDYSMKGRTYRYFEGKPVYRFGDGLSYTEFSYGTLKIQPAKGGAENGIDVAVDVANVGGRDGDEVAELYLKPPAFGGAPKLALRGFARVHLNAGEHKDVHFSLSSRDLSFVTADGVRQLVPGEYLVAVGSGQPENDVSHRLGRFQIHRAVPLPK